MKTIFNNELTCIVTVALNGRTTDDKLSSFTNDICKSILAITVEGTGDECQWCIL